MKKLMLAAALVAATTAANAAVSLSWGADWLVGHDFSAEHQVSLGTGGTAYLVDANLYTALLTDVANGSFNTSSSGIMWMSGLTNDGDIDYGTYFTVKPSVATDINYYNDSWVSGQATKLYTVVVDGDWIGISNFSVDGVIVADLNTQSAPFGTMSDWDDSTQRMTWYTQTIPEPTSGLLLLLGVAGLALRRRRA